MSLEGKSERSAVEIVDQMSMGFQEAQVLLSGVRLGVFAILGSESRSLEEIVRALRSERRGTRILCDALVGMGLLEKDGHAYRNSHTALQCLLPGSPESRVARLWHAARQYEKWGRLCDSVRNGRPPGEEGFDPRLRHDERQFALAMADAGRASAPQTAQVLDLSGVSRLLDVGGGPGLYAVEFVTRYPDLKVTLMDRPETLKVAREQIREAGMADRVELKPGDVMEDSLDGPYDLVFVSNLVHIYPAEANRRLVERCARALAPGGRLCIKDFLMDSSRTSPPGGALFAVNMLVATEAGDCYTVDQVEAWYVGAGLNLEEVVAVTPKSSLAIGRKRQRVGIVGTV